MSVYTLQDLELTYAPVLVQPVMLSIRRGWWHQIFKGMKRFAIGRVIARRVDQIVLDVRNPAY